MWSGSGGKEVRDERTETSRVTWMDEAVDDNVWIYRHVDGHGIFSSFDSIELEASTHYSIETFSTARPEQNVNESTQR